MNGPERAPLEERYKFCRLDTADIMAGEARPPLGKDAGMAWELYRAGLACTIGMAVYSRVTDDPLIVFIGNTDVQQRMADYRTHGTPVYLGPSALIGPDGMTVVASDVRSSSFGLWTPRPDVAFDPSQVVYTRLN